MNRLIVLACCLGLLLLSVPAPAAAEEAVPASPEAAPAPAAEVPATSPEPVRLGPYDALPMTPTEGCPETFYSTAGYHLSTGECRQYCEDTGGTFWRRIDLGRGLYACDCCPA